MAIVKILARHNPSYASLIRYQLRYVLQDIKNDKAEVYTQNLRSNTVTGYIQEFIENEAFRRSIRSDQIFLTHEVISFHRDENGYLLSHEVVEDLAYEYMRLRGEKGVILTAVHRDKDHVHLHACVSALEYRTGKSFGLNKRQLQELKVSFQEYHKQRYPELTKSAPQHGRGGAYFTHGQWHAKRREEVVQTVTML